MGFARFEVSGTRADPGGRGCLGAQSTPGSMKVRMEIVPQSPRGGPMLDRVLKALHTEPREQL